jgi:serine/threonine protein kinase
MTGVLHKAGDLLSARYRIESYIGEGGMQEVYKAQDLLLSKDVAVKVPKNNSAAKRFSRSAVVSAKINHANVTKTLDYFETKDRAYLVEEYVEGKDLSRVLKEEMPILDPLLAARLLHHLAKGLAASHHATVVHGDLKPSNIMVVGLDGLAGVKITDFGIAKMAEEELAEAVDGTESSLTASQTAIGALPYMAPEMIKSVKKAGMPADIWSLGALAFELISGEKPFGVGYRAVPAILEGKVSPLPTSIKSHAQFKPTGEEVYKLIQACLQVNPAERPTADELVRRCEKLCYPNAEREFGTVAKFDNKYWGFIAAERGKQVFFHIESVYGDKQLKVGDRVWFARHRGGGSDRAFPVTKLAQKA